MRIARRMQEIAPFRVMQILAQARALETAGRDIVHMEIGEPDFESPRPVIEAAMRALRDGQTRYTPAAGLPALREAIADYYARRFAVSIDPARVLITPGASGALQLVLGALVDPGDRVVVTDPGYPCNRHMISQLGGVPVALPVSVDDGYAVRPDALQPLIGEGLRALMLASPANPTGNLIGNAEIAALAAQLRTQPDTLLVCDEIYQGLQYDAPPQTALALGDDNIVVINSFSKFFGMTGWRVGWLVAPEGLVEPLERLAQNLFIAAPTPSQFAALAAFEASTMAILEERREAFRQRRDFLYDALTELGFGIGARPAGAFYLYADIRLFADDGETLCRRLLEGGGVAITPGVDFGAHLAGRHVRFAYTTDLERLAIGVERIAAWLRTET